MYHSQSFEEKEQFPLVKRREGQIVFFLAELTLFGTAGCSLEGSRSGQKLNFSSLTNLIITIELSLIQYT